MHKTHHVRQRMTQRGIKQDIVEYVLNNGMSEHDRIIIDKKEALRMLEALKDEQRLLKRILDKGGVVVVAEGNALITTYNYQCRA